jgi:hypothetical protein
VFALFDEPWQTLDLAHVRAFLDDAGDEGVTWEAKADDERGRLHADALAKAACGLANQVGGYILIGAKQPKRGAPWELPGITPPRDDPTVWIGKVLRGLQPQPRHDEKHWTLDDGRLVAVVRIEPVAQTPCMTRGGRIYERVSGETLPVEDPSLLDRLLRRGDAARERAEQFAVRAADRALDAPEWRSERALGIAVALAAVGRETDDISSRLFTRSFRSEVAQAVQERLVVLAHMNAPSRHSRTEQDAFSYFLDLQEGYVFLPGGNAIPQARTTWHIQATWDGAVAASMSFDDKALWDLPDFDALLRAAWSEVVTLVARLGGYGPAYLAVRVAATDAAPVQSLYARLPATVGMGRVVSVGEPDDDVIASLSREVERAGGGISDEPEPDESTS